MRECGPNPLSRVRHPRRWVETIHVKFYASQVDQRQFQLILIIVEKLYRNSARDVAPLHRLPKNPSRVIHAVAQNKMTAFVLISSNNLISCWYEEPAARICSSVICQLLLASLKAVWCACSIFASVDQRTFSGTPALVAMLDSCPLPSPRNKTARIFEVHQGRCAISPNIFGIFPNCWTRHRIGRVLP